jgi:predicted transglutaminase-like cysteine proteinase
MSRRVPTEWFIIFGALIFGAPVSDASPNSVAPQLQAVIVETPRVDATIGLEIVPPQAAPSVPNVVTASLGNPAVKPSEIMSEPFGLPTSPVSKGMFATKWAELQARLDAEQTVLTACRSGQGVCPPAAREFLHIIDSSRHREGRAQLGEINRAINLRVRPVSDMAQYGVDDYWASPIETLSRGGGDCEDYAIAKYVALMEVGVAPDDLRLVIVRDLRRQAIHAVVAVYRDGEWVLMDNRTLILVDADAAPDYSPLYVLDHQGVRAF